MAGKEGLVADLLNAVRDIDPRDTSCMRESIVGYYGDGLAFMEVRDDDRSKSP